MKYRLEFEGDFEKGECEKCPLSYRACAGCESDGSELYCVLYGMGNCPLEEVKPSEADNKQSDWEWISFSEMMCRNCGTLVFRDFRSEDWAFPDACPNCGTPMKGGK